MTTFAAARSAHAGLDEIEAHRLVAVAIDEIHDGFDGRIDDASALTWTIEGAIADAESLLTEHAAAMPAVAVTGSRDVIGRISRNIERGIEIDVPGSEHTWADAMRAANRMLAQLEDRGYRLLRVTRP